MKKNKNMKRAVESKAALRERAAYRKGYLKGHSDALHSARHRLEKIVSGIEPNDPW